MANHRNPLEWIGPTGRVVERDPIDLPEVHSVEFVVDQANKVWLNVNGVCVFRTGCTDAVTVEDSGQVTVLRTDPKDL